MADQKNNQKNSPDARLLAAQTMRHRMKLCTKPWVTTCHHGGRWEEGKIYRRRPPVHDPLRAHGLESEEKGQRAGPGHFRRVSSRPPGKAAPSPGRQKNSPAGSSSSCGLGYATARPSSNCLATKANYSSRTVESPREAASPPSYSSSLQRPWSTL